MGSRNVSGRRVYNSDELKSAEAAMQTREISNQHPDYLESLNQTPFDAYYANYFVDQVERHFAAHPPPRPPEPVSLEDQPLSRLAPLPLPRQQTQIPREANTSARARQQCSRSTVAAAAACVSSRPRKESATIKLSSESGISPFLFPPSLSFHHPHVNIGITGSHEAFEDRPLTQLHKARTQTAGTPKGSKQASPISTGRPGIPEPSKSPTKPKTKTSTGAPGKTPTSSVSLRRPAVLSKKMVIEDDDDDDDALEDEEAPRLQNSAIGGSASSQGKSRKTGGTTRSSPKEDEDDEDVNLSAFSESSRKAEGRLQSSSGERVRGERKGQVAKDRVSFLGSSQGLLESALIRKDRVATEPSGVITRRAKGFPAEVPAPSPLASPTGGTVAGVKQAGKADGEGKKDKTKTASPRGQVTQPDTSFLQAESQAVPAQGLPQLPQDKEQDVMMGGSEESGSGEEKQGLQLSMLTRAQGTHMSLHAGDTTGTGGGLSSALRSGSGPLDSPSASPLKVPPFLGLTVDTRTMGVGVGAEGLKRALSSSDGGGSLASPFLAEKDNEGEHAEKKTKPFSDPAAFGTSSSLSNVGQSGIFTGQARDSSEASERKPASGLKKVLKRSELMRTRQKASTDETSVLIQNWLTEMDCRSDLE
uniref:Uncharacterized protein n=1 Tax=Chromera velia CCMP2878 TaxID=1169474 RepID=A0A0G4HQM9_9ALVE|eukprot:Cvel_7968.t1-p1 / transcript=Cvel_7968.t1 / gene=Cvel_7968 / organism=Chromera_velia_CCMP2878 / gene_product=hypothetical protein / transcript_product=hypothetical protein / location=Cvel_scaffold429:10379-13376(-) / protein_length=645 / sequence_SO=supercontig / SO=protein_coding / is_pseudo=false